MEAELKEVAKLFQAAYRTLTMTKCRVTAMAYFNRAQYMLDALEKGQETEVVREIKKMRAHARKTIGKDRSLHTIMQVHASIWGQEG